LRNKKGWRKKRKAMEPSSPPLRKGRAREGIGNPSKIKLGDFYGKRKRTGTAAKHPGK
jgi:hypothetical protein